MEGGNKKCPRCGRELPGGAWNDDCPKCLAQVTLGSIFIRSRRKNQGSSKLDSAVSSRSIVASSGEPRRFGDYELLEEIGRGGSAIVWRARQLSVRRIVAIKLLRSAELARAQDRDRFRTEAEAVASLQHPHIVALHDFGEHDGQPWISLDFVEGRTLAQVVRDNPIPGRRAAEILKPVAEAIGHANDRGVLHRDIKPSNILIDERGRPRITDFGLAKRLDQADPGAPEEISDLSSNLTLSGQLLGTPHYAPPEQLAVQRGKIGPHSDVYGLGAVLYELLTGRPPFLAATVQATLLQVIDAEPAPPRQINREIPADLETICLKCLAKEPARRYQNAHELAEELGRFLRHEPIRARPVGYAGQLLRWTRRKPALSASIFALLATLLCGSALTFWQWRRAEGHARALAATVTQLRLDQAEERLTGGQPAEGLSSFASLLRGDPNNEAAAQRIVSVLQQRSFIQPLPGLVSTENFVWASAFAQHRDLLMTSTNRGRTLRLFDTKEGFKPLLSIDLEQQARISTFNREGTLSLVGTQQRSLRLYDLRNGSLHRGPYPLDGFPEQLVLSPNASLALVVTVPDLRSDNWQRLQGAIIRLEDGARLHTNISFHWAEYSPDGRSLVTVSNATAVVRDANTFEPIAEPLRDINRIYTASFSGNSQLILTACAGRNASVWEAATGRRRHRLEHALNVQAAFFSPDAKRVLSYDVAANGRFWDTETGRLLGGPFTMSKGFGSTSFSPDGQLLLTYFSGRILVSSGLDGTPVSEPFASDETPTRVRFLPDGRRFVSTSFGGATRLWKFNPGETPAIFKHTVELNVARLSRSGKYVATASKGTKGLIWNADTRALVGKPLNHEDGVIWIALSPDEQTVITTSFDYTARLWKTDSGDPIGQVLQHTGPVVDGDFSPDNRWVVTASQDGTARIWNATNGLPAGQPLEHRFAVSRARFSPDGKWVASAGRDHTIRFWSVPQGQPLGDPIRGDHYFSEIAFSPDGRTLAACGEPHFAQVWDVATRRELIRPAHADSVNSVGFDSDGGRLVTASHDRTARIWDIRTGAPLARPMRHADQVDWAGFSPDGRFVLTVSRDHTARLWHSDTGHAASDPFRHNQRILTGEWAHNGRSILTASYDGSAKLWPLGLAPDNPAPVWIAELAEASGGLRRQPDGTDRRIPLNEVTATHQRLQALPETDRWSQWVKSLYEARASR